MAKRLVKLGERNIATNLIFTRRYKFLLICTSNSNQVFSFHIFPFISYEIFVLLIKKYPETTAVFYLVGLVGLACERSCLRILPRPRQLLWHHSFSLWKLINLQRMESARFVCRLPECVRAVPSYAGETKYRVRTAKNKSNINNNNQSVTYTENETCLHGCQTASLGQCPCPCPWSGGPPVQYLIAACLSKIAFDLRCWAAGLHHGHAAQCAARFATEHNEWDTA